MLYLYIMDLKSLFDITKLPTKILVVFSVITGVLLFSSKTFLSKLQLSKVHETYGSIVGIIFLVSTGIIIANLVIWVVKQILVRFLKSKLRREKSQLFSNLNFHEKSLLREFFLSDRTTIDMPLEDATVSGLLSKGLIHIVQQFSGGTLVKFGSVAPVKIDDFVFRNIRPEHLDIVEPPTEKDIQFYHANRPDWVAQVEQINRLMNGKF